MYCCVEGCGVVSKHDVTLFPMPIAPAHRRRWLSAINPSQKLSIDAAVCSKHFSKDHLVFIRGKIRLKPKVVPSLFGDDVNDQSVTDPVVSECEDVTDKCTDGTDKFTDATDKCTDVTDKCTDATDKCTDATDKCTDATDKCTDVTYKCKDVTDKCDVSDRSCKESDSDDEPIVKIKRKAVKRKRKSVRRTLRKKMRNDTSDEDVSDKSDVSDSSGVSDRLAKGDKSDAAIDKPTLDPKQPDISLTPDSPGADKGQNSAYNILVTPSIEFYCNDDEPPETETVSAKHDIEDILTNYQIKQNNIHSRIDPEDVLQTNIVRNDKMAEIRLRNMQEAIQTETLRASSQENGVEKVTSDSVSGDKLTGSEKVTNGEKSNSQKGVSENEKIDQSADEKIDKSNSEDLVAAVRPQKDRIKPVFISVTETQQISSSSEEEWASRDCFMLLEKLQVQLDPAALHLDDDIVNKEPPISLLTSSDESDVILQEPRVDTVEVSDETDEDEVPLVNLMHKTEVVEKKKKADMIGWSKSFDFFCYECNYTAKTRKEFNEHKSEHTKVLQVCDICQFTTASKFQFLRHRRRHKDERRYKCHVCSFKAKHHMSLIYHLKRHNIHELVPKLTCDSCKVFQTNDSKCLRRHKRDCTDKKYPCEHCDYSTKRARDLLRHMNRKHAKSSGDEYKPTKK